MSDQATVSLNETEKWIGRAQPFTGVDEVSCDDIRRKLEVYCFDRPPRSSGSTSRCETPAAASEAEVALPE